MRNANNQWINSKVNCFHSLFSDSEYSSGGISWEGASILQGACNDFPQARKMNSQHYSSTFTVNQIVRMFKCPYCNYKTKHSPHVKRHIKSLHPGWMSFYTDGDVDTSTIINESAAPIGPSVIPVFLCPYCPITNKDSSQALGHVRRAHKGCEIYYHVRNIDRSVGNCQ